MNFIWSPADCGQPLAPDQGTVALTGTETTYQATATQSCNTGYNRSTGDGTITCQASGFWSTSYTCAIVGSLSNKECLATCLSANGKVIPGLIPFHPSDMLGKAHDKILP